MALGVLGGGQLGRMFALAARRMGYRVHTYSPEMDTPTGQVADVEIIGSYDDLEAVRDFHARTGAFRGVKSAGGIRTAKDAIRFLDETRAHDAEILKKLDSYLPEHDTDGLQIEVLRVSEATRFTLERARNGEDTIYDVGLTPVFRLEGTAPGSAYFEAAIGFHLLSDLQIDHDRPFSTRFQFGDHIGVGRRFGPRERYDLSLRLQHLSNGGIRRPNPGIDFLQLRFQYHLE